MPKAILLSQCPGTVRWWAVAVSAGSVVVDTGERTHVLRHDHHRYSIVGPQGVQQLTIPLAASTTGGPLADVRLSEHGRWRHVHFGALYSAYGRTPYFEHAAPELERIITGSQTSLLEFTRQVHDFVIDFMQLPVSIDYAVPEAAGEAADLRPATAGKRSDTLPVADVAYYQIWQHRHGFHPRLSIFDLLMHEGPQGLLTLLKMAR